MVSDTAKDYLRKRYGENYYGWDIEDHHLKEILTESNPATYEELDEECTKLANLIRECERMQRMIAEVENAR